MSHSVFQELGSFSGAMNGKLEDIPDEDAPDDTDALGAALGSGASSLSSLVGLGRAIMLGMGFLFI
jgi:hypothetical protein